jgi:hypothetical protein
MSTVLQRTRNPHRQELEADLAARVAALFGRCPTLYGFSVQLASESHGVVDLTCYPAPDRERAESVLGEVTQMLSELEEEQPEAAALLPGRTFARNLH